MKKRSLHLNRKLFLNKETIANLQLGSGAQQGIVGGSATCDCATRAQHTTCCPPSANPPCTKAVTQCVPSLQQSACPDLSCGFACTAINCLQP